MERGLASNDIFYSIHQPTDSEDSAETWETVSAERERWVRMAHHLEVLTLLSNVIGVGAMRTIPPVPSVVVEVEEEEEKGYVTNINILDHQVQLLQNGEFSELVCMWNRINHINSRLIVYSLISKSSHQTVSHSLDRKFFSMPAR